MMYKDMGDVKCGKRACRTDLTGRAFVRLTCPVTGKRKSYCAACAQQLLADHPELAEDAYFGSPTAELGRGVITEK